MTTIPTRRLAPAALLACAALLLALSGIAHAGVPRNSVGPKQIKRGAVKSPKLARAAVKTPKLARQAVKASKLAIGAVKGAKLADGAVGAAKVAPDSLGAGQIDEGALDFSIIQHRLLGSCPPGQAIRAIAPSGEPTCQATSGGSGPPTGPAGGDLAGSYPNPAIGAGKVTTAKLGANSVDSSKVVNGSLTGADISESTLTGLWFLGGNAGTSAGTDFLGTTDAEPLELHVDGARALRLEPASDGANVSPNVIGGSPHNEVTDGVHSATIAGGGVSGSLTPPNRVTDYGGTVGGGVDNQAGDGAGDTSGRTHATVAGGLSNTASGTEATVSGGFGNVANVGSATAGGGALNAASGAAATVGGGFLNEAGGERATVAGGDGGDAGGDRATVAGGDGNTASGSESAVGGGFENTASGLAATVGGGRSNAATGNNATVPGGNNNTAQGFFSFAAGRLAKANHRGAFVWADDTAANMTSSADNQFIARASGGFFLQNDSTLDDQGGFLNTSTGAHLTAGGAWTNSSDENLKEAFEPVDSAELLEKVAALPVRSWSYKAEPGVRHLGPVAQDFHRLFGLGADDRHIAALDAGGVALAAAKAVNERLEARVGSLRDRIDGLETRLGRLEREGS